MMHLLQKLDDQRAIRGRAQRRRGTALDGRSRSLSLALAMQSPHVLATYASES